MTRRKNKKGTLLIYIEYLTALVMMRIISLLTYKIASDVGGILGRMSYWIDARHRHIAHRNLHMAFPEMDKKKISLIAREAFENLGRSASEIIYLASRKPEVFRRLLQQWVKIEKPEELGQLFRSQNGILFLTAHFGNWELLGIALSSAGCQLNVVARPMDNPRIDQILTYFRSMTGTRIIPKKGGLKEILKRLRRGEAVGILIDQNTSKEEGVFVDFFGRLAATNRGPSLIGLKSNVPVVPVFIIREERYSHRILYSPEIILDRTGDIEKDVLLNTEKFTKAAESVICQYPEQWLWMHQRWKTQP